MSLAAKVVWPLAVVVLLATELLAAAVVELLAAAAAVVALFAAAAAVVELLAAAGVLAVVLPPAPEQDISNAETTATESTLFIDFNFIYSSAPFI
jgi:hypothetical protein